MNAYECIGEILVGSLHILGIFCAYLFIFKLGIILHIVHILHIFVHILHILHIYVYSANIATLSWRRRKRNAVEAEGPAAAVARRRTGRQPFGASKRAGPGGTPGSPYPGESA